MDVILLTKVANLGTIGDRVKVKSGYGRNFLLPKGKATLATPDNVKKFEARRAELEKVARDQFQDAESRAAAFKEFKLQISAKAGTEGKLFGSIGTADIAEACTAQGHKLARAIHLDDDVPGVIVDAIEDIGELGVSRRCREDRHFSAVELAGGLGMIGALPVLAVE